MSGRKMVWVCAVLSTGLVAGVLLAPADKAEAGVVNSNRIDQIQMVTGDDTRSQRVMFLLDGSNKRLLAYKFVPQSVPAANMVPAGGIEIHRLFQAKPSHMRTSYMMVADKMVGKSGPSIVTVFDTVSGKAASFYHDGSGLKILGKPRSVHADFGEKVK